MRDKLAKMHKSQPKETLDVLLSIADENKTKILTDIRDYLVKWQKYLAIESRMCPKIRETDLVLSMIEDLQKYAEKLGVDLWKGK